MRGVKVILLLVIGSWLPQFVSAADDPNEVPFRLFRGYIIIARGSIGPLQDLNFVLDTGAVPSVLDARVAHKLGLQGQVESVSVFSRQLDSQRATAISVRLGPLQADRLPVLIQELAFMEEALGTRVDAILGFDFLCRLPFTLDYRERKILFGPIDPSFVAIPYRPGLPYIVIELELGTKKLNVVLDTGASDLVLFRRAVGQCRNSIVLKRRRTWSNMGGELRVQEAELTDAYIGGVRWTGRRAILLEDDRHAPRGLAGLLGPVALDSKRVAFDPQRRIIAWEPKEVHSHPNLRLTTSD